MLAKQLVKKMEVALSVSLTWAAPTSNRDIING